MKTQFVVGHLADVGLERDHQEDAYSFQLSPVDAAAAKRKGAIFVVADGVGGYQAGEQASRLAVGLIPQQYYASPGDDVVEALRGALSAANEAVYEAAKVPGREKMATTVVCAVVRGSELYVGHVGDSRAYLLQGDRFTQLTVDHSWVAEQVRLGLLSEGEAFRHPRRNVITRSLGSKAKVEPEVRRVGSLGEGDRLLLCTDGLYEGVEAEQIGTVIAQFPPQLACQKLIDLANAAGGSDNTALIVAEVHLEAEPEQQTAPLSSLSPLPAMEEDLGVGGDAADLPVAPAATTVPTEPMRQEEASEWALEARQQALIERQQDLREREQALEARQQALAEHERELQERRQALVETQQDWQARQLALEAVERGLAEREQTLARQQEDWQTRQEALEVLEQSLSEREQALALPKEVKPALEALERTLNEREQALAQQQSDWPARQEAVEALELGLAEREQALQDREQTLAQQQEDWQARQGAVEALEHSLAERELAWQEQQASAQMGKQTQMEREQGWQAREESLTQRERQWLAHQETLEALEQALAAREQALPPREQELAAQEQAQWERRQLLDALEQTLAERDREQREQERILEKQRLILSEQEGAWRSHQATLEVQERELAARIAEVEQRERTLAEREQAAGERDSAVAGLAADLEREKEALRQQSLTLRVGQAERQGQLDALQREQERLTEARRRFGEERAAGASEREQAQLALDRQREDLQHLAAKLSKHGQALEQREQQLAEAEARAGQEMQIVAPVAPAGGRSVSQWECVLGFRAGRDDGECRQEETIKLPSGHTVVCGLAIRREYLRRQYPMVVELWASSEGSRATRLLIGHGLDVRTMPVQAMHARQLSVIVNGDEMVPLPLEQVAVHATVTCCEFATAAEHKVARDNTAFVALTVLFRVEMR